MRDLSEGALVYDPGEQPCLMRIKAFLTLTRTHTSTSNGCLRAVDYYSPVGILGTRVAVTPTQHLKDSRSRFSYGWSCCNKQEKRKGRRKRRGSHRSKVSKDPSLKNKGTRSPRHEWLYVHAKRRAQPVVEQIPHVGHGDEGDHIT